MTLATNIPPAKKTLSTPLDSLHALTWQKFRLVYRFLEPGYLPQIKNSTWRGLLGHALRKQNMHLYNQLFECILPEDHPQARRFHAAPNPYIVDVPDRTKTSFHQGDKLAVDFTLIGKAVELMPHLLPVLHRMSGRGLGARRAAIELTDIHLQDPWESPLPASDTRFDMLLELRSPVRILHTGGRFGEFNLPLFCHRLAERAALLAHFHGDAPLLTDYSYWQELAEQSQARRLQLEVTGWERYSNRAKEAQCLNGWTGQAIYAAVPISLFPLLQAGQNLHVGKATTWGLGAFSFRVLGGKRE